MRKALTIIIIEAIVCALLACGIAAKVAVEADTQTEGNSYALTTMVVEVDRDNDIVTCEDSNGNLWDFYGVEDWMVGDCASLLMNDQGTLSVYDDTIEGARYNAWTLMH